MTPPAPATPFDYESALAACARGDRMALRNLYERDGASLLGTALRIVRQRALAEDVVQDAFLRIWKGAASFDPTRGSGRGWIHSIVRNAAFNAVRDGAAERPLDDETLDAHAATLALEAFADQRDAYELTASLGRLRECLQALEPVRRNCVLHAYVDGLSQTEVAQRVGAPLGTVKAWIRRSLLALRTCMG